MRTRRSRFCPFLSVALFASLGCLGYRTPLDDSAANATAALHDASPDSVRQDALVDLRRSEVTSDLPVVPPDLAADSRSLGPDLLRDVPLDLSRDLSTDLPRDLGTDLTRDPGPDTRRDLGPDLSPGLLAGCTPGQTYVLVLGGDSVLYRFDPDTLSLGRGIATVSCGTSTLNSLTVSPIGPVYISNHAGQLCVVDTTSFTAALTSFDATTIHKSPFGMALLPDNVPAGKSLYIAVKNTSLVDAGPPPADTLSRIDLSTFNITTIGPIERNDQDGGTIDVSEVELTAGPNGELYGFAIGSSSAGVSLLLTMDPTTGRAINVTSVGAGYDKASFALVDWQGTFYLFLADDSVTSRSATVYTYHEGDEKPAQVATLPVDIIGAGVAMCH
jgi:hypothetical protein